MSDTTSFTFPYSCDACGAGICERMPLFSLAQGIEEEAYCPNCLSQHLGLPVERWLPKTKRYIQSRDCFRKPWNAVNASTCPLRESDTCLCLDDEVPLG